MHSVFCYEFQCTVHQNIVLKLPEGQKQEACKWTMDWIDIVSSKIVVDCGEFYIQSIDRL